MLMSGDFAGYAGVSERTAQRIFARGHWIGHRLPLEAITRVQGGCSGQALGLRLDLCPKEVLAELGVPEVLLSTPAEPAFEAPLKPAFSDRHICIASDRQRLLAPILATERGSAERAAAIEALASQPLLIGRKLRRVSRSTLYGWLGSAESKPAALIPSRRSDRGRARVLVTRAWDDGIDLADEAMGAIAKRLVRDARSMAANDGTTDREIIRLCGLRLQKYSAEAGCELPGHKLKAICRLNTKWAKRIDLAKFRLAHQHDKDHGGWQNSAVPRIRRKLHDMPMGLLLGDVHYADLLVEEEGEPIRVRLIAWLDTSSLFAWVTPVFLSKGKGITQADVAESLSQAAFCAHGGIPQHYYLDNGAEYAELASAMMRLSGLAEMRFGVTLAKPYSPTSKGEIEGFFNILEGLFKGLPGWIGGDRTNKKSQNKGKVVAPYSRGLAALEEDIRAAVAVYNSRPQSGRLAGLSPLEMLEQKIAETGVVARVPSEEAFDIAFSRLETRVIRQGTIHFEARQWHTPAMDELPNGEPVEILVPLRKQHDRLYLRHSGKDLGWAWPLPEFEHGDRDGARLQGRLERGRVNAIRRLKAQTDPGVSTFDFQKAAVGRIAPDAPAPERWSRAIDKTAVTTRAELEAQADEEKRAVIEEYLKLKASGGRRASGGNR